MLYIILCIYFFIKATLFVFGHQFFTSDTFVLTLNCISCVLFAVFIYNCYKNNYIQKKIMIVYEVSVGMMLLSFIFNIAFLKYANIYITGCSDILFMTSVLAIIILFIICLIKYKNCSFVILSIVLGITGLLVILGGETVMRLSLIHI